MIGMLYYVRCDGCTTLAAAEPLGSGAEAHAVAVLAGWSCKENGRYWCRACLAGEEPADARPVLTPREFGVLLDMADGRTYAEIAKGLFLAEGTVRGAAGRVFTKLGVTGRSGAVGRAFRLGMIP